MSSPAETAPRILCVDDRVSSLEVRRALLRQMGYDVLLASDPPSALAILGKVDVDLVVLDYSFPGQMSGEELAHLVRAKKPDLPLIMLSGYPDLPASVTNSVDVLLLKGAGQPADLLNAIARLLKARGKSEDEIPVAAETPGLLQRNQELMERAKGLMERVKKQVPGTKA